MWPSTPYLLYRRTMASFMDALTGEVLIGCLVSRFRGSVWLGGTTSTLRHCGFCFYHLTDEKMIAFSFDFRSKLRRCGVSFACHECGIFSFSQIPGRRFRFLVLCGEIGFRVRGQIFCYISLWQLWGRPRVLFCWTSSLPLQLLSATATHIRPWSSYSGDLVTNTRSK